MQLVAIVRCSYGKMIRFFFRLIACLACCLVHFVYSVRVKHFLWTKTKQNKTKQKKTSKDIFGWISLGRGCFLILTQTEMKLNFEIFSGSKFYQEKKLLEKNYLH